MNILIIESDLNYCKNIINTINQDTTEFKICGIAANKDEYYSLIGTISDIDIILFDFNIFNKMNIYDFINFEKTIILIIDDEIKFEQLPQFPFVCDYINKNDSIFILRNKFRKVNMSKTKNLDLKRAIYDELIYLGYMPTHKGFKYLLETIYIKILNLNADNLSKDIYPIVAKKFNTTIENVKYNIRNATEAMYYNCREEKLIQYVGYDISNTPKTKLIVTAIENHIERNIADIV